MPPSEPTIVGSLHPATGDGFKRLLREANRVTVDGYDLMTVLRLGDQLACVFKRRSKNEQNDSFFE